MSIRVMSWVWDNAPAKGGDLLLLLTIADHADNDGRNAWPSLDRLAARTRADRRTVQRRLRRLESQGLLTVRRQAGPGGTNLYAVPMRVLPAAADTAAPPVPVPPEAPMPPRGRQPRQAGAAPAPPEPSSPVREPSPQSPTAEQVLETTRLAWSLPRGRLAPLRRQVARALSGGAEPAAVTRLLAGDVFTAESPTAVLRARLTRVYGATGSPAPPSTPAAPKPAWCGGCDPTTRHRENSAGHPYRCPHCHPLRLGAAA